MVNDEQIRAFYAFWMRFENGSLCRSVVILPYIEMKRKKNGFSTFHRLPMQSNGHIHWKITREHIVLRHRRKPFKSGTSNCLIVRKQRRFLQNTSRCGSTLSRLVWASTRAKSNAVNYSIWILCKHFESQNRTQLMVWIAKLICLRTMFCFFNNASMNFVSEIIKRDFRLFCFV